MLDELLNDDCPIDCQHRVNSLDFTFCGRSFVTFFCLRHSTNRRPPLKRWRYNTAFRSKILDLDVIPVIQRVASVGESSQAPETPDLFSHAMVSRILITLHQLRRLLYPSEYAPVMLL